MFQYLQLKRKPHKVAPDPGALSLQELAGNSGQPIALHTLNGLPDGVKERAYRLLAPPELLARFGISPITWRGQGGETCAQVTAPPERGVVTFTAHLPGQSEEPFFVLELADNSMNGVDLNWVNVQDPQAPRFTIDRDADGKVTWGSARRNLAEEQRALEAGLAPGQARAGLNASQIILQQLDSFLAFLAHQAVFLEPLTYASAWLFERRGFAYMRGHKLMDDIQREFQPGGRLQRALDGSTPFRRPEQWRTVRGRAWAIHDGILSEIDARWDNLRMIKQTGRQAGVVTFPEAVY